jgi:tetratricopeptide (TPR) repeat protein
LVVGAVLAAGCTGNGVFRMPFSKQSSKVGLERVYEENYEKLAREHRERALLTPQSDNRPAWMRWMKPAAAKVDYGEDAVRLSNTPSSLPADMHLQTAKLHEQRGNVMAAAASYQQALDTDPLNEAGVLSYARLYDRAGQFEDAAKLYKLAVDTHPDSAMAHNDYGLCAVRQGDNVKGLQLLSRAVELTPDKVLYRNNIAQVLASQNRLDEALRHLQAVHPPSTAHYNLAYWLQQTGNTQAALAHCSKAAELDPQMQAAHEMIAQLQQQAGY